MQPFGNPFSSCSDRPSGSTTDPNVAQRVAITRVADGRNPNSSGERCGFGGVEPFGFSVGCGRTFLRADPLSRRFCRRLHQGLPTQEARCRCLKSIGSSRLPLVTQRPSRKCPSELDRRSRQGREPREAGRSTERHAESLDGTAASPKMGQVMAGTVCHSYSAL